jgi:hypothetical protein
MSLLNVNGMLREFDVLTYIQTSSEGSMHIFLSNSVPFSLREGRPRMLSSASASGLWRRSLLARRFAENVSPSKRI